MFKNPKGTQDFFPEDKAVQQYIFSKFREVAEGYNFREIETPAFEELGLLTEKEGDEIVSQIFTLDPRGKEKFGLRFDLTVPVVRMFLAQQKSLPKPVKWYYLTRMWRYERPQKGRMREFYQFGIECFGTPDPAADAETVQLAVDSLRSLGLTHKDFFVRLNNRKLLQGILTNLVPPENFDAAVAIIDKREKIPEDEFFKLLKEVKVKDPSKIVELLEITDMKSLSKLKLNELGQEGLAELKEVYSLVDKDYVRISLDTVRGLAYYTGTVFEIFDTGNKYRSICGGGRYDKMVGLFGGQDCPAVGFGMGYSTLTLLLEDKGLLPKVKMGPKYYIACVTPSVKTDAMHIAQALRGNSSVEMGFGKRSLGKQFNYADSINADYVVIVGEKDLQKKQVTIRDLSTGKEKIVKLKDLSKI